MRLWRQLLTAVLSSGVSGGRTYLISSSWPSLASSCGLQLGLIRGSSIKTALPLATAEDQCHWLVLLVNVGKCVWMHVEGESGRLWGSVCVCRGEKVEGFEEVCGGNVCVEEIGS